ncbi:hypothetical protein [Rhizobium sp. TRM95796]|uniref:hypothetical protein n=1 Tax=Rhizobium sp. TRM95796 TaxID=2979862 RepID=UPI0021E876FF|nr:hypothetical protein [Rhizobium sp. TRM95796]MCV3768684.1 hypothetical protein [Rhizobium sp. TRM95796]
MPGAPLSRWTMSYFAVALACLLSGLSLMGLGFGFPSVDVGAPDTLVLVHLIAIGWLGLLFLGALLQFAPVLAAGSPRYGWVAAPTLVMIVIGLLILLLGFLSLGGWLGIDPVVLPIGGLLLFLGFSAHALSIAATLTRRQERDPPGLLVLLGLLALAATAGLGLTFSSLLGGVFIPNWAGDVLAYALPAHAFSGLVGWMTLTAIGVSYRLFSMFMLAPEKSRFGRLLALAAFAGLLSLWAGAMSGGFVPLLQPFAFWPVAIFLTLTLAFYLADLVTMIRARRRKALELNTSAGLVSVLHLPTGLVLIFLSQTITTSAPLLETGVYSLAMGWLSGLGLAQLYKIVPFLTWLEAYGPVMGRSAVPRVQDLVREPKARMYFALYHVAVIAGGLCLLLGLDFWLRLAAWMQFATVAGLGLEFFRARRLSYAPESVRLPSGAVRPHLVTANPN